MAYDKILNQTDPEKIIKDALVAAGYEFLDGSQTPERLDFYLVRENCFIEIKQFYSERVHEQMSRNPNVIVVQGIECARFVAKLLLTKIISSKT